jgi:hypothetical protein
MRNIRVISPQSTSARTFESEATNNLFRYFRYESYC